MAKHRISDANKEIVTCKGPYDMFCADDDEESKEALSTEEPSDVLSMATVKKLMDINESMNEKRYKRENKRDEREYRREQ